MKDFIDRVYSGKKIIKHEDGTTETVNVRVKYLGEGYCQLLSGDIKKGDILTYTKSGANMMMMGMPGGNQGGR